ncbi:unnamed protein product, partial [Coccothraustes coccothraustes]
GTEQPGARRPFPAAGQAGFLLSKRPGCPHPFPWDPPSGGRARPCPQTLQPPGLPRPPRALRGGSSERPPVWPCPWADIRRAASVAAAAPPSVPAGGSRSAAANRGTARWGWGRSPHCFCTERRTASLHRD